MSRRAQIPWFGGGPGHEAAPLMLLDAVTRIASDTVMGDIDPGEATIEPAARP